MPPCAYAWFVSEPLRFVITATEPCLAAFNAKLRPAMPLPITTKSYSLIAVKRQSCLLWLNAQTRRQDCLHHDVFVHAKRKLSIKRVFPKNTATASNEFGLTLSIGFKVS